MDPQQAGRELLVANVVTGHYMRQGNQLLVTLQAVNVGTDSVSWQSAPITAPGQDFIALQEVLTKQVRSGLASRPGVGNGVSGDQHAAQESGSLRSVPAQRGRSA